MFPIPGLIEIVGIDLLSSREQMMKQGFSGLGPPDLVVLTKSDQSASPPIKHSHHCVGLQISSPSSFPAYFAGLTRALDSAKRGPRYSLVSGLYCCWNSFADVDIHLSVFNPGSCGFYYTTPNNESYKVSDLTWRELSICTVLRFWRGVDPIFSSLFDIRAMYPPAVSLTEPPILGPDDIRFAVAAHRPCDDLEIAVAHGLLAISNAAAVSELISEISHISPRVLMRILRYCPPRCPLFSGFARLLGDLVADAADDVAFVFAFISLRMAADSGLEKCQPMVPLLLASLWNESLAGIALAKLALAFHRPENSLLFLNASCVAVKPAWLSSLLHMPNMPSTKSKDSPKNGESPIESELMISQLSGPSFHLYRTIAVVARDIGLIRMQTILRRRFFPSRIASQQLPRGPIFPMTEPQDFVNAELSRNEMALLVDPGLGGDPVVPRMVENLPTCQQFIDAAQLVLHDLQVAEAAKKGQEFANDFEAMKMVILGLRLGDFQLSEIALAKVQVHGRMDDLLRVRLMCEAQWTSFEGVFHPENRKTTIGEHNALVIARTLFGALTTLAA
jgi:hypothetical protein